jgi:asparagine synthase (glutamine-hydrolysing)
LRSEVLQLARSPRLRECGMIDTATIARMAAEHLGGLRDHSKGLWLTWVFDAFLAQSAQNA